MANFLSWLTGGGESPEDAAERQLIRSAKGGPLKVKAAPVVGRAVQNDAAEDFLRGLDFFRTNKGLPNPYERSGWVQQAITLVANPILAVPLRFAALTARGATVVQDQQLASFWRLPAAGPAGPLSWSTVISATVGWMKLAGEAFWIGDDTWLSGRAGPRNPFFMARPDSMFEVMAPPSPEAPAGTLLGWRFRDTRGKDWPLVPEQVFHPHFWNPYNPVRGMGQYPAAAIAAQADVAAAEFAKNLMESNGDRGPIVSVKDGKNLSKQQQDQVEAAIKEKMAQVRSGGLPKPLFLTADVSVAQPAVAAADSDFVAVRVENRKEIFMIFGVPSSFAEQMHRATSAHESDRFNLIEQTCIPTAAVIAGEVEKMSRNMKGLRGDNAARLTAFFDWDEHSTMVQVRSERVDAWKNLTGGGMPAVLAGQYLGMRLPSWKGDDVSLVPLAIQTLEEVLAEPEPPANPPKLPPVPPAGGDGEDDVNGNGTTEEDQAADAEEKAMRARMLAILAVPAPAEPGTPAAMLAILDAPAATVIPTPDTTAPAPTAATLARAASDDARERLWRKHAKVRAPAEKSFGRVVKSALFSARGQVLAKLQRTKAVPALATKDDDDKQTDTLPPHPGTALDVMFDPVTFGMELSAGLDKVARVTMQQAGEEVRAELGVDDPWTMEASDVFNALRERANLIKDCGQGIFDDVLANLEEGFAAGETTDQLAARVRSLFNDLRNGRAKTFAVTETGAAYGGGREAGAASIGYKTKSWLSARDSHVRPTHTEADGQTVDAKGLFSVGGEQTPWPCGDGLSAKEACGCRCVTLYHT